ncbi:hypothetical protein BXO88_05515 [Oribacterium sp. C9]|uniref:prephenate dehydratase n=1 Tax=Oribacterium sp. C9 TaxID=1943579 RepID=UPI00098F4FBA|nr:prephenate dehydratase domain-containing protein [Oribacterium sp. C9]OON86999.1 hypothetical protein BXO88_05515 [Oribacterium sp. C9]
MKKRMISIFMSAVLLTGAISGCGYDAVPGIGNTVQETIAESQSEGNAVSGAFTEEAKVSFLGPAGTYTEEATQFFFKERGTFIPKETVADAISDVVAGEADYAVIPQENTLGGAVTGYVDALIAEKSVYVVGEVILPISQTLMGVEGAAIEDIKTVCSHAQGIKQTEKWRAEHMPDADVTEMASTAAAASYVAEQGDKTIAAIAAPGAAELYGLTVIAENVQITDANKTRFYVLSKNPMEGDGNERALFVADCEANRIDDIILAIHDAGLEMVTIHDRPEGSKLGRYNYIIETEKPGGVTKEEIEEVSGLEGIRFLGSFNAVEKK